MEISHVVLLWIFISSASSLHSMDGPAVPVDTRPWPYRIYLQSAEITISEKYGSSKILVRKDKSDNLRKVNGYLQLDKQIDCTVKGGMVAMIKSNNIWVENYKSPAKPYDAFVKQLEAPMDSLSKHTGMSNKCPVEPGNYTFDRYAMEAELFPRDIQPGEYVTTIKFTKGIQEIGKFVFFSILEPVI